jgi:vanillate O-demethylase monooxygenase subunit
LTPAKTALTNTSVGIRRGWLPVGMSGEFAVEVPVRTELCGDGLVVTRRGESVDVFLDKCPHRNARLSEGRVVNGCIECPYHGWQFDSAGHCTHIPALGSGATVPPSAHLSPLRSIERYGMVWVALEDPVCELPEIAEWSNDELQQIWLPPIVINAAAGQFVDNFLDFGHFPFVHAGTFGSGEDEFITDYEVAKSVDGWSFVVDYPHTIHNNEDPLVAAGEHPLVQPRNMTYTYTAPFSITLRLELPLTGVVNMLFTALQPMTVNTTRVFTAMLRNDCGTPEKARHAIDYEMAILAEDLKVIERLWDKAIPLELGQAHTRADKNTVEFRRIMQRLLALG